MKKTLLLSLALLLFFMVSAYCQQYSIVIKGGRVIDPKSGLDAVTDIAIADGKIAAIAKNIDTANAIQVVNAKGLYVSPGLIDIHGHVFSGTQHNHYLSNGFSALRPDGFTFRVGVTTIVDCGGAGWSNFNTFKENVILNSRTRVLSFLNIVGNGMRGGAYEQDTADMDPQLAAALAIRNRKHIVGFKVAHYSGHDWTPVDNAVLAGEIAEMPVIIDFGQTKPPLSLEELFMEHLRKGDIFTHTYALLPGKIRETVVDEVSGQVKPFVWEAKKKGIVFDVGYGGASFNYSQAIPAFKQGFFPNTISTDLHTGSMNTSMKDMLSLLSKFLAMGMDLPAVIQASTWGPAQAINRRELGHLSEGGLADVAIFSMRNGHFGFYDKTGFKMEAKQKLECEMTILGGEIVYDLNGIAQPIYVP